MVIHESGPAASSHRYRKEEDVNAEMIKEPSQLDT